MFDTTSRYAKIEIATTSVLESDGTTRQVNYVRRRIIPPLDNSLTVVQHTVTQGERLDNITAMYLGDPLQFWLLCDSNNVLRPTELTDTPGRVIDIVIPHL
jgi:hypothetical protein